MTDIAILDGEKWTSGTDQDRLEFAQDLCESLGTYGFAKFINHGLSDEAVDQAFQWNQRFFNLPQEEKRRIRNPEGPKPQRGWSSLGTEKTSTLNSPENKSHDGLFDSKEHFDCGPPEDMMFPNQWPEHESLGEDFRDFMESYFNECQAISLELMKALELGFNLPTGTFTKLCEGHASELRLNHYPAEAAQVLTEGTTKRIWPHTDFGLITLLLQDSVGGLEIYNNKTKSGFIPIEPSSKYDMIINVGDVLQRWSNDFLHAGLHQVNVPPAHGPIIPERFSVVFFLKSSREQTAGALGPFVTAQRPSRYEDISALEFQRRRTGMVYA